MVQHLLSCSPYVDNPALGISDSHLRSALCWIANVDIFVTDRIQVSLLNKYHGLGYVRT